MGIMDDPTVLTCGATLVAYIPHAIHKYRRRPFDVYARTAELEHENHIPHIDPKVIKACTIDHDAPPPMHYGVQGTKWGPGSGKPSKIASIIQLGVGSVLTPNEMREIEGRFRHAAENGKTMVLPEPCRYDMTPIYPDPDILDDKAYAEWMRDGKISSASCTCNNCVYEGPGEYECVYIMADNRVIDVITPEDTKKSHTYVRGETESDRLFAQAIEAMRNYQGESNA